MKNHKTITVRLGSFLADAGMFVILDASTHGKRTCDDGIWEEIRIDRLIEGAVKNGWDDDQMRTAIKQVRKALAFMEADYAKHKEPKSPAKP